MHENNLQKCLGKGCAGSQEVHVTCKAFDKDPILSDSAATGNKAKERDAGEREHVFLYANLFAISGIVLGIVMLGTYFQKISWLVLVYNSGVSLLQFCCSKDSEGNYPYVDRQNSFLHS